MDAVRWVKRQGFGLVSSAGMQTWDLVTAVASIEQVPLELAVPIVHLTDFPSEYETLVAEFSLAPALAIGFPVTSSIADSDKRLLLSRRDRYVVQRADLLLPICVRPDGNMAELITLAERTGKRIVRDFETPPECDPAPLKYSLDGETINHRLHEYADTHAIHWTRSVSHAWPGERLIDLYRDTIAADRWPRTALATLSRILDDRILIASRRHMPGNTPCVCFSALPPTEVLPLMRWRARYGEMSFEPYGLGIRRDTAESAGIVPVRYVDPIHGDIKGNIDAWCCQSIGRITDWRAEKEYRHKGDLHLDNLPREAITLFCRTTDEARDLTDRYGYHAVAVTV